MIRNHQYKNSEFVYVLEKNSGNGPHRFTDLDDTTFSYLPEDHRFGCKEYSEEGFSEQVRDKVWARNGKDPFV